LQLKPSTPACSYGIDEMMITARSGAAETIVNSKLNAIIMQNGMWEQVLKFQCVAGNQQRISFNFM